MSERSPRGLGVMPLFAGVTGVVLMVGTVIGQAGHDKSAGGDDLMAGMNMSSGSMSSMPGMSMGSGDAPPAAPAPAGGGGSMTMPDGSTMASSAMPMNMSDPNMAATMPGGLHTTCKSDTCTVIFAPTATGLAKVLGTTAKLDSAKGTQVVLTVGKKRLTLRQGKPVRDGKMRVELTSANAHAYTVKFTKTH